MRTDTEIADRIRRHAGSPRSMSRARRSRPVMIWVGSKPATTHGFAYRSTMGR